MREFSKNSSYVLSIYLIEVYFLPIYTGTVCMGIPATITEFIKYSLIFSDHCYDYQG